MHFVQCLLAWSTDLISYGHFLIRNTTHIVESLRKDWSKTLICDSVSVGTRKKGLILS